MTTGGSRRIASGSAHPLGIEHEQPLLVTVAPRGAVAKHDNGMTQGRFNVAFRPISSNDGPPLCQLPDDRVPSQARVGAWIALRIACPVKLEAEPLELRPTSLATLRTERLCWSARVGCRTALGSGSARFCLTTLTRGCLLSRLQESDDGLSGRSPAPLVRLLSVASDIQDDLLGSRRQSHERQRQRPEQALDPRCSDFHRATNDMQDSENSH